MVTTRAFYLTLGPGVSTFGPFSLYLTTSFSEGIRIKKLPGIFMPGFFLFLFGGYDTAPYICTMTNEQIIKNDKARALNVQINNQLRGAGVTNHKGQIVKPLSTFPASEWKTWILELMEIRDQLYRDLA